jgi:hypothetical protein
MIKSSYDLVNVACNRNDQKEKRCNLCAVNEDINPKQQQ